MRSLATSGHSARRRPTNFAPEAPPLFLLSWLAVGAADALLHLNLQVHPMAIDSHAPSLIHRPLTASKQFLSTEQSRARYLDFIGFHRARAHGRTVHDDELQDVHDMDPEVPCPPSPQDDPELILSQNSPSCQERVDRPTVKRKPARVMPEATDAEDTLRPRLRAIFASIRKVGREISRASTYYKAAIAPATAQSNNKETEFAGPSSAIDVVEQVLSRMPKKKKKKDTGFEDLIAQQDRIAEWRYDAMKSEIRHRRGASARRGQHSHADTLVPDSDVDFIVKADLAAYLYINHSKLSMDEIEELWQVLMQDVDAKLTYKMSFEQFEMWLLEHHPKFRKMNRFVLTSFATDDSFESAFALEDALIMRRDEIRKKKARANNKVNCCGYTCVANIG